MEDSKQDKGYKKKIKYVRPELISLDKDNGAEGGIEACGVGSGAGANCTSGPGAPF